MTAYCTDPMADYFRRMPECRFVRTPVIEKFVAQLCWAERTGIFYVRMQWTQWKRYAHRVWVRRCDQMDRPIVTVCMTNHSALVDLLLPTSLVFPIESFDGLGKIARGACPGKEVIITGGSGVNNLRVPLRDHMFLARTLFDYAIECAVKSVDPERDEL